MPGRFLTGSIASDWIIAIYKITQRAWPASLIGLVFLTGVCAASAEWKEAVTVDGLTGKQSTTMTNAALNSARQFGRKVSAKLVLRCVETPGRPKTPNAAIIFSERVATDPVRTKYRLDNDLIQRNKMASVQNDGAGLGLGWAEFMSRLPSSSILRIEFNLPWAGDALIEFDMSGASEAFSRIQCTRPRAQL